jgi:23S rRNA (cytidine1920-2'-O)/16S rRNA (cytidine1409-2'-O)-methyltransferase
MRADQYLTTHGHYDSRARAQAAIKAGLVSVDGKKLKKPSEKIKDGAVVQARREHPWVSRGGVKLDHALNAFGVDAAGRVALDVGSSTGGFSHVLITRGAIKVYAVDVGHGQLHSDLRGEAKIISMEGQDARSLSPTQFEPAPDLIVCDASFISAMKVLETPLKLAARDAELITLVKPQFEVGKVNIGRGGIVKTEELGLRALDEVKAWVRIQGWQVIDTCVSPIKGGASNLEGNVEYLLHAKRIVTAIKNKNPTSS